jgi:hypothetical protein
MTRVETKYRRRDEGIVPNQVMECWSSRRLGSAIEEQPPQCDFCHSQPAFGPTNLPVKAA